MYCKLKIYRNGEIEVMAIPDNEGKTQCDSIYSFCFNDEAGIFIVRKTLKEAKLSMIDYFNKCIEEKQTEIKKLKDRINVIKQKII